eukprot:TRINITY_DN5036_c0_g1_i1.p1 TRINITY_DN5036_c0_g1~~TRINITY_DN5036_c0_g1_i1.p1  ORF type:complete len:257 (+),score=37.33 TRINITY_DN5036_c0_g1_i1:11-781(+)
MSPCFFVLFICSTYLIHCASAGTPQTISYRIYPSGKEATNSSCYPHDPASKWAGYVTASNISIPCGSCVKMTSTTKYGGKTIYAVRIDIGQGFDLNQPAFNEMCGDQGYLDKHCDIIWSIVDLSYCKSWVASHGGSGGVPPPPPPTSTSTTTGSTSNGGCRTGYVCTSTDPQQNPGINWPVYCKNTQGGYSFCQLGVSGCGCVRSISAAVNDEVISNEESSVGMWVGIGLAIGFVLVVIIVGVVVYLKRRSHIESV